MRSIPTELARSALDAAPDAMIIIDSSGCILYVNRQVSALFGYSHDDIIHRPVEQLMPERFRSRHIAHRHQYTRAAHLRPMGLGLDLFAQRQDGTEFPVEISLSPIESGDEVLIAAAIRDVTDRKRADADLVELREAAERAQHVAVEARISADRANQGKSRFLATASHDLRQPLQSLALLNRTLRTLVTQPNASEALSQQENTIVAMSRLLNALLDISKLESGAIKPEPADFTVAHLFDELRREFAGLATDKGLDLHVEESTESVHSDQSLVEEIFRNLVSNAIKYTRAGWVRLRCLREASSVHIEVLDSGIGIPLDQIPYIFDEFYQVGVPTHSFREGYGLGLSIVQRIASLLNLALTVHSEPGQGSAFTLTLPAGNGETPSLVPHGATSQAHVAKIRRGRILLVEDDPSVRNATRLLLAVEGYDVTAVESLADALEAISESKNYELVVTDYHLRNGETGVQVIAALRVILGNAFKALLITGDTSSVIRRLTEDSNLRIISKPVNADELLSLLETLLPS